MIIFLFFARFHELLIFNSFLFVAIPLKSELAYEVLDKGEVRFWIQAESLSPDSTFRFVINDREVENSDVSTS